MGRKALSILAFMATIYLTTTIGLISERTHANGVLVENSPYQSEKHLRKNTWKVDDFVFSPLAEFSLDARVLSSERYWLGDSAKLAPVDLALGWGPMSDSENLDKIKIRQNGRFYYWRAAPEIQISEQEITRNSANMHLIPANKQIAKEIKKARKGDLVEIDGYLVGIDKSDGWKWKSSLTREDSGAGACEIIWVERFKIKS